MWAYLFPVKLQISLGFKFLKDFVVEKINSATAGEYSFPGSHCNLFVMLN